MLEIKTELMHINVKLDNGVYLFDRISATGKTRLSNIIKKIGLEYGAIAYSYDDVIKLDTLVQNVDNIKLLVLDRYDLYVGNYDKVISRLYGKTIILIDCKSNPCLPIMQFPRTVKIINDENYIEIGLRSRYSDNNIRGSYRFIDTAINVKYKPFMQFTHKQRCNDVLFIC